MENNFENIRIFLFKELKRIATLPRKTDNVSESDIANRIESMEKIVKMIKESLNMSNEEIEKINTQINSSESYYEKPF